MMGYRLTDSGHVDYPHVPGAMIDCPRCEAQCFCRHEGERCIYCQTLQSFAEVILAEQDPRDSADNVETVVGRLKAFNVPIMNVRHARKMFRMFR